MAIVKQEMSYWSGSDRKTTSHSNFKLRNSKRFLDVVRVPIWCDLRSLVTRGNHLQPWS